CGAAGWAAACPVQGSPRARARAATTLRAEDIVSPFWARTRGNRRAAGQRTPKQLISLHLAIFHRSRLPPAGGSPAGEERLRGLLPAGGGCHEWEAGEEERREASPLPGPGEGRG